MATKLLAAASLLAVASAQSAGAVISNNCDFPVYYKTKIPGYPNNVQSLNSGDEPLTIPYTNEGGAGYSVLMSPDQQSVENEENVSQLEITNTPGKIWYDLSNVNSSTAGAGLAVSTYPFAEWGFTLGSSQEGCGDGAENNCATVGCEAGISDCTSAYQFYNDDQSAMHDTTPESNIQLNLCQAFGSGSSSPSSGSSGSSGMQPQASSAQQQSTPSSTFTPAAQQASSTTSVPGYTPSFPAQAQATTLATAVSQAQAQAPAAEVTAAAGSPLQESPADAGGAGGAGGMVTVTQVDAVTATAFVTARSPQMEKHRRHEHIHRHAHGHA